MVTSRETARLKAIVDEIDPFYIKTSKKLEECVRFCRNIYLD
ncbi:hypothetical protein [Schnuerera ultunensis]